MATAASALTHSFASLSSGRRHHRRILLNKEARCFDRRLFLRGRTRCVRLLPALLPLRTITRAHEASVSLPAPEEAGPEEAAQEEAPSSKKDDMSSSKEETSSKQDTSSLKLDLLGMVAGLDRGLLASQSDQLKINTVARLLEEACGPVKLGDGEAMQGRWRLVYSSAFVSGSLGGLRPGPPVGVLPITLGQVYQRIDVLARELDNIVELQIRSPWPLPPLDVVATLAHTYQVFGENNVKITFQKTSARFGGGLSQLPPFTLPQLPDFLRPSGSLRSGSFDCTYLDDSMRITRGDRGELRIFVKA